MTKRLSITAEQNPAPPGQSRPTPATPPTPPQPRSGPPHPLCKHDRPIRELVAEAGHVRNFVYRDGQHPLDEEGSDQLRRTNPFIPDEEYRLRDKNGVVTPPPIEVTKKEYSALLGDQQILNKDGRPRKAPVHLNVSQKRRYVELLARFGLKGKCAKAIGQSPLTVQLEYKADVNFRDACDWALEVFRESIEEAIHDRAIHGWEEPVFSQRLGTQIGTIHRYDSRLLELLVKRHVPEYRDKQQIDVKLTGGVLVTAAPPQSVEDWKSRHEAKKIESDVIDVEKEKSNENS